MPDTDITPSEFQRDIYDRAEHGSGSVVVEAKAGSGKTYTALRTAPALRSGLIVAFNKAIQLALEPDVPPRWEARTFNSVGYEAVRQMRSRPSMAMGRGLKSKNGKYATKALPPNYKKGRSGMAQLMSLAKSMGVGYCMPNELETFKTLFQAYNIDIPKECRDKVWATIVEAYYDNIHDMSEVDFDDQLLYPLIHNLPMIRYPALIVDELQDASMLQLYLIRDKMLQPGGRVFGFGDTNQAIYAFRGADSAAMNRAREMFTSTSLPLSICYRCPTSVIGLAQTLCPEILPAPDAPVGRVNHLSSMPPTGTLTHNSFILCRNNAPLVTLAMQFLSDGNPCRMANDISRDLLSFIASFKTEDIKILLIRLDEWYVDARRDAERAKQFGRRAFIEDRYRCILPLAVASRTVSDINRKIEAIFRSRRGPLLSTIHKAKGLQAPHVYLIRPDLIPGKWAKTEEELTQEYNLLYVAYTRAQQTLNIVGEEDD